MTSVAYLNQRIQNWFQLNHHSRQSTNVNIDSFENRKKTWLKKVISLLIAKEQRRKQMNS